VSHNIKLSGVKITDLGLLGDVIRSVSGGLCVLDTTTKTFRTYRGEDPSCDAVIKMPGMWDIGLRKQGDEYAAVMESALMHQKTPLGVMGAPLGLVQQEIALREGEYLAAQNGWTSERVVGEKGRITLSVEMPA
jgi:hypothetical protein